MIDLIEIDVPVLDDRLVGLFVLEFVCFRLLAHASTVLRERDGANLNQIADDCNRVRDGL